MTGTIKRIELRRALGTLFRQGAMVESHAEGNGGILNPQLPVADKVLAAAIDKVRHRQGEDEVPLLDVVDVELARFARVLGEVNEKRGKRGYSTIAADELAAAAERDPDLAPKLYSARDLLMHVEPGLTAPELAEKFAALTAGMLFMSEEDHPYQAFCASLHRRRPLDIPTLKSLMTWDVMPGAETTDPSLYPNKLALVLRPADDFWLKLPDGTDDAMKPKWEAIDKEMLANLVLSTGTDQDGSTTKSTLWTVTPAEAGATCAPLYIFGRTKTGAVVGLKTWRIWTG
jgi:hypothetical protein